MDSLAFMHPRAPFSPTRTGSPGGRLRSSLAAALALALLAGSGLASAADGQAAATKQQARQQIKPLATLPQDSGLSGELFFQLLVGELQVNQGQPGAGYTLMLNAARKHKRPELFRRAVEIALQARSGDAALQAAHAWAEAQPRAAEPQRFVLQILQALDRPAEMGAPLDALLRLTPAGQRQELITALPQMLVRLSDKSAALKAAAPMLQQAGKTPALAAAAWTSLGRLQLAAGQPALALESANKAMTLGGQSPLPAWLGLMLVEQRQPGAELLVQRWLARRDSEDARRIRLEYARLLTDQLRPAEAREQLAILTRGHPELAEPWLLEGLLSLQQGQLDAASAALQRYLALQPAEPAALGRTQARLLLSQVAEKQGQLDVALSWLDRVDDAEAQPAVQTRRALLLARQGKLAEARALLRGLPAAGPADERRKLQAEAQMLRELGHYAEALEVYAQATQRFPQDADLAYERAMVAEKAGQRDEMERLLRELIARSPDYGHAYNALGYSLADRNVQLEEARALIQRAIELMPDDPFIQDSLGWVEFRLGNLAEARRVLQAAFERRADPEIAAHLGEVLWTDGQQKAARAVWRQGLQLQIDSETLLRTLQRLQVQP